MKQITSTTLFEYLNERYEFSKFGVISETKWNKFANDQIELKDIFNSEEHYKDFEEHIICQSSLYNGLLSNEGLWHYKLTRNPNANTNIITNKRLEVIRIIDVIDCYDNLT